MGTFSPELRWGRTFTVNKAIKFKFNLFIAILEIFGSDETSNWALTVLLLTEYLVEFYPTL